MALNSLILLSLSLTENIIHCTLLIITLLSIVLASPLQRRQAGCASPVALTGNPFASRSLHGTKDHSDQVLAAAASIADASLSAKATKVASIRTFLWLDDIADVSELDAELPNVKCTEILGIVITSVPEKGSCSTVKPTFKQLSLTEYKAGYIKGKVLESVVTKLYLMFQKLLSQV